MPKSVPNYLTTNPDGTVSATFTGEVSGRGFVLPTGAGGFALPEGAPPSTDDASLEWRRIILAGQDPTQGEKRAYLYFDDGGQLTIAAEGSPPDLGLRFGAIVLSVTNDQLGWVSAQNRVALRDDGYSDFPSICAKQRYTNATDRTDWVNLPGPGLYVVHAAVHGGSREAGYTGLWEVPTANNLNYPFYIAHRANYASLGADCWAQDPFGSGNVGQGGGGTGYSIPGGSQVPQLGIFFHTNGVPCTLRYTITALSARGDYML